MGKRNDKSQIEIEKDSVGLGPDKEDCTDNSGVENALSEYILLDEHQKILAEKTQEAEVQRNYALMMQADLENLRKRTAREKDDYRAELTSALVEKILPVYDNLERAMQSDASSLESLLGGIEIIVRQLYSVLESFGMEKVEAEACLFDPECHEAVVTDYDGELPDNHILEELQKGYKIKGKLIRPAMVKVNKHI
jgi:molecular chaperone GrpE